MIFTILIILIGISYIAMTVYQWNCHRKAQNLGTTVDGVIVGKKGSTLSVSRWKNPLVRFQMNGEERTVSTLNSIMWHKSMVNMGARLKVYKEGSKEYIILSTKFYTVKYVFRVLIMLVALYVALNFDALMSTI